MAKGCGPSRTLIRCVLLAQARRLKALWEVVELAHVTAARVQVAARLKSAQRPGRTKWLTLALIQMEVYMSI
jgi:hypothetical protein